LWERFSLFCNAELPGSRTASKAKQDLPPCAEFFVDFLSRKSKNFFTAKRNEHLKKIFTQLASGRKLHKEKRKPKFKTSKEKIPVRLHQMQSNWNLNLLDKYVIIVKEIAGGATSALPF